MKTLNQLNRVHYDKLVGANRDFKQQIDFLDKLFKKYKVKSVLDCGCGTGTHSSLLAKKGYCVSAFDYSKNQIALAKKKAKQNNVNIKFYVADLRDFDLGKYDAIISLYAPIMFACKNNADLTKALNSMKKALNPNGIGFIETMTSKMMLGSGIEITRHVDKKIKIARVSFYTFNTKDKSSKIKYVEILQKGNKLSYQESMASHKYFDRNDFNSAFKKSGLKVISWYSSFDEKKRKYDKFDDKYSWMISPFFQKIR
jgi:2-polyprenyl-3-methyl-5-hydroxy-6-metoxy-1,4-benzoquinol methylase